MTRLSLEEDTTVRIAMWSGPRNLSTALMRAFGNRPDCAVADEPFYAAYLRLTGLDHPMREAILKHHETDWREVAAFVSGPAPGGKPVFYQKHMTHHMIPEIGRDWMRACHHAFLIRHPAQVVLSYAEKREAVELRDIGFIEQAALFDEAAEIIGHPPPVVDAGDVLADPAGTIGALCGRLGIPFSDSMLTWQSGPRESDGVWGSHWYDAVNRSTGFAPPREKALPDDLHLLKIVEEALPLYEKLATHRLGRVTAS